MVRESLAIFADFPAVLGLPRAESDIGLRQQGYLFASADPQRAAAFAERVARQRALGLADVELLDGDETRRRSPWLAPALPPGAIDLAARLYTMTPDHKPLIGPAGETAGLWLHTGYSGHGIMGSPSGARLRADLIVGRAAAAENPFAPGRFAAGVAGGAEAMVL